MKRTTTAYVSQFLFHFHFHEYDNVRLTGTRRTPNAFFIKQLHCTAHKSQFLFQFHNVRLNGTPRFTPNSFKQQPHTSTHHKNDVVGHGQAVLSLFGRGVWIPVLGRIRSKETKRVLWSPRLLRHRVGFAEFVHETDGIRTSRFHHVLDLFHRRNVCLVSYCRNHTIFIMSCLRIDVAYLLLLARRMLGKCDVFAVIMFGFVSVAINTLGFR